MHRILLTAILCLHAACAQAADLRVVVEPAQVQLRGNSARQQLIVGQIGGERDVDLTRNAQFVSEQPAIVAVNAAGLLTPKADGTATIVITSGGQSVRVPVTVTDATKALSIDFENDVTPILTSGGCNSGPCHGKARGQNGFQLSLLGFDGDFDHAALSKEGRGRRIFQSSPERSLLLLKPTGQVPHGGGKRLEAGGADYLLLKRWIEDGLPRRDPNAAKLVRVTVSPTQRSLAAEVSQQLIVTAHYSDKMTRDVTSISAFASNESAIAGVDKRGLVTTTGVTGEAAVMARYMGMIAVSTISVPLAGQVPDGVYEKLSKNNYIDELVWKKLKTLSLTPSEPAPDYVFLRRAFIDIIGRVPQLSETKEFFADAAPNKRQKLVDRLLESPEYVDHWANKWADLLRPNPYHVGIKTTLSYDNWIRDSFRLRLGTGRRKLRFLVVGTAVGSVLASRASRKRSFRACVPKRSLGTSETTKQDGGRASNARSDRCQTKMWVAPFPHDAAVMARHLLFEVDLFCRLSAARPVETRPAPREAFGSAP